MQSVQHSIHNDHDIDGGVAGMKSVTGAHVYAKTKEVEQQHGGTTFFQ